MYEIGSTKNIAINSVNIDMFCEISPPIYNEHLVDPFIRMTNVSVGNNDIREWMDKHTQQEVSGIETIYICCHITKCCRFLLRIISAYI